MRSLILVSLLVLTLVLAGCQPVTVEQATATYCQSLETFHAATLALRGLDETSTIDEIQATIDMVQVAYREMQQAAAGLTDAEVDAVEQAYQDLSNVRREIEGTMTVEEAKATIVASADAVDAAWEQLYADGECVTVSATPAP